MAEAWVSPCNNLVFVNLNHGCVAHLFKAVIIRSHSPLFEHCSSDLHCLQCLCNYSCQPVSPREIRTWSNTGSMSAVQLPRRSCRVEPQRHIAAVVVVRVEALAPLTVHQAPHMR